MQLSEPNTVPLSQRTSEGVARVLREEIFSGNLKPGESLPERTLAEGLGVSRTPVREALFTLQSEGLVELTPNRGATVRRITSKDIVQIYSLRAVLEAYAAAEAARTRTRKDIDALLDAQAKLERVGVSGTAHEQALADLAFHRLISDATGSSLLRTIMGQVLAFTVSYRSRYSYPAERAALAIEQHRNILEALRAQDSELAERLMAEHVESSREFALKHFDESENAVIP
ncbi:GntR family transcriptional regulator [Pseudonocardia parietis]|uniref:DNA-binding GntR family transcriptional regulator n=1 Tax=Pseudonocardia parietis TaxID=570936 RepID=A0ABS4VSV2_9PSEU|nr:GntR family transcriptional regulator [Pseudonocardia parietis]MBP2366803.1 DNA-binding GntR family transcriptional regulator [Pseudonocardia parietis]